MIDAETFWSLKRNTRPATLFTEVVPDLPPFLPAFTASRPVNVHVRGADGGVWWVRQVGGRLESGAGAAAHAVCQVMLERSSLKELIGGSLRDRGLQIMAALGQPRQIPDLRRLPVDDQSLLAIANLPGSVAVQATDRELRETHRFVFTFGAGTPAWEQASTTVSYDVDDQVTWLTRRMSPIAMLRSGRVRLEGDLSLPVRALQALLGDAAG